VTFLQIRRDWKDLFDLTFCFLLIINNVYNVYIKERDFLLYNMQKDNITNNEYVILYEFIENNE